MAIGSCCRSPNVVRLWRNSRLLLPRRELADIAPLLEVEDMLIMGNRPDSKCVFTYVQFMYNHLKKYDQPLVVPEKSQSADVTSLEYKIKTLGESEDL